MPLADAQLGEVAAVLVTPQIIEPSAHYRDSEVEHFLFERRNSSDACQTSQFGIVFGQWPGADGLWLCEFFLYHLDG
jgi:hypothetical protein